MRPGPMDSVFFFSFFFFASLFKYLSFLTLLFLDILCLIYLVTNVSFSSLLAMRATWDLLVCT